MYGESLLALHCHITLMDLTDWLFQADLLGKKYEEKYKQVAEIASKLTIEEAKFREYQVMPSYNWHISGNLATYGSNYQIFTMRCSRLVVLYGFLCKAYWICYLPSLPSGGFFAPLVVWQHKISVNNLLCG